MALDPLKFQIAIDRRKLDGDLEAAKKEIKDKLTNVPISIKIANLDAIKQQLQNLEVKVNVSGSSSQKKETESLKNTLSDMEKFLSMSEKVTSALSKMNMLEGGSKNFVDGFKEAKTNLAEFSERLSKINTNDSKAIANIIAEWKSLSQTINQVTKDQEKLNGSDTAKFATSMENAKKVLGDIDVLINRLNAAKTKAGGLGIDTSAVEAQISALKRFREAVDRIANGTDKVTGFKKTAGGDLAAQMTHAKDAASQLEKEITKVEKANEKSEKAAEKNARATQRAAQSASQFSSEEQKLAQSIQHAISQMNHQSQVLNDLKSMAMQYLSVYAGQQFLNNIIEIGGQLEMQRLSIGAILQDTAHANDLFEQIKGLALQSPFGVVELDQFTKQLSAYGFKYNELFDMTKRLADISAGAGTDVSRLALALGHVRAEGALTGYTLRQFAMNNIPMLGKLSEKLSELEGKIVTAADVRKRVRNKEIDYDMVESVIKDLTNEGGMFYNMQEVISGSVKAKWKNLHDAFDIMFGEMAESGVGGALKDVATTLTTLAKRWKELGTVVMSVAAVYGTTKAIMLIHNTLLGQQVRGVFAGIAADRQAIVSKLRLASTYRTLTLDERVQLGMGAKVNSVNLAMAINTKKLTAEQLAHSVALGKVNRELAIMAIMNSKLDPMMKMQMYQTVASVRTYTMFTGAINGLKMAFVNLGIAMKGLLTNPMTWVFAAVAVITDLWQRNNQEMEQAAELSKKLSERSVEGIKNVRTMMKETDMTYNKGGKDISASFGDVKGGTFKWTPAEQMDTAGMIQTMEKWTDFINQYAATPNILLGDAWRDASGKVRDLADQYEHLAKSVAMVAEAQVETGRLGEAVEYALGSTDGGWFNENLVTNLNDYAKRMKSFNNTLTNVGRTYPKVITAALNAAKTDAKFAQAVKDANDVMLEKEGRNLTEIELVKRLYEGQENYNDAFEKFKTAANQASGKENFSSESGLGNSYRFTANAKDEAEADMQTFADSMKAKMKDMGWDLEKLTESQKQAILYAIKDVVGQSADSTEELKKMWESIAATYFGIKIDADTVEAVAKTNELEKDLDALVNGDWVIDIKAVTNFSDLLTKIRQDYKTAQDYFNNVKPFMIKFGVSMVGGMKKLTKQQRETILANWRKANPGGNEEMVKMLLDQWDKLAEVMGNALDFSANTGLSLSDPNPGGKVFRDKKGKKNTKKGSGRTEDTEAKKWKERIRLLRDARSWYDKWEKEIGHTAALKKVQEQFHNLVTDKEIESLEAYEEALNKVLKAAQARKKARKGNDEHADEVIRQIDDEKAQIDMLNFQQDSEVALGRMDKYLDKVTLHWETFNSVLETTGDRLLAMKLAGFDEFDSNFASSSADALMNRLSMELMLPDLREQLVSAKIMDKSDKEIDKYIKDWLGGTEYKKYIDAVTKGVKEWKKMEQNYIKESVQDYARLIGSAVDYQTEINKINAEYEVTRQHLIKLLELGQQKKPGGITKSAFDNAISVAQSTRNRKMIEILPEYKMLMDGVLSITQKTASEVRDKYILALNKELKLGRITAKDYADKIKAINDRMNELQKPRSNFVTFMQSGLDGIINKRKKDAEDATRKGAEMTQEGMKSMSEGFFGNDWDSFFGGIDKLKKGKELSEMGEEMSAFASGMESTVMMIDLIVHEINSVIQGLKQSYDQITDMLEALGSSSAKDPRSGWGKLGTYISALSSGSQSATSAWDAAKSGDIGGVISGVVGSITGPITTFAKAHDARRQAAIDDIKKNVEKINNTLNLIQTSRGRTLGYDDGEIRKRMARNSLPEGFFGNGNNPMYEYYTRGGLEGNGYEQELAALKEQREDYLRMYDEENDKKNESVEALEEYKAKIADLDDKIMFYTEDLAKELWSIDLKGWADQIGDALMNAFENGTSAALAFKDATQNILRSVVSEMLKVGIIEPMMENLREKLFGKNGAFDYSDPSGSMGKVLAELGRFFGEGGEGQMMMVAGQEFLTGAEQLLNENFGMTLKGGSSQSTQTNGIQSQATEESIGIVSGQLARIAQDVSVKRIFVTQLVTDQMPKMLENAQLQRTLLENQFQSVRAIEHMMSDGSGAMYESIDRMSRKLDRAITPDGRMRVE